MEVHMDRPDEMGIHAKKNLHGNPGKKIIWTMKLALTQPFFEIETQDFAWKSIQENSIQGCMQAEVTAIF